MRLRELLPVVLAASPALVWGVAGTEGLTGRAHRHGLAGVRATPDVNLYILCYCLCALTGYLLLSVDIRNVWSFNVNITRMNMVCEC